MVQKNSLQMIWNKAIINSIEDTTTGCWLYQGYVDKNGYPNIKFEGKTRRLSRMIYLFYYKEDPGDKFVCHTCDIPCCVCPSHLFLGSPKDNTQDMILKGRNVVRTSNNKCKNGCDIKYHAKGLCKRCYNKRLRSGEQ